ncbi:alpha/beta hydrolase [Aspergillus affinis]|uniref:alpha/beta hydrolase n=1 Tax=Aspergillus affinis TaxID=1070780 RepID=UPI0022FEDBF6|nr:putative lipase/esterase [Aspergillus affinis]KAI9041264.1 putative lipase/esterase [Aspergillus affinis]
MSNLNMSPGLLKAMIARVPLILKTVLLHGMRLSPVSGKQDLRTELTVVMIRSLMNFLLPVGVQQKHSMGDPGIKGPMWVSKVTFPAPEDAVQDAVLKAIEHLKTGGETFDIPDVNPVEAEWTGYRNGVGNNEPQPEISEEEKYKKLQEESQSDMVILYFHGGAYFLMDPCTHRPAVARLSKLTGARVLSVRYRLAPQHPFPSALLDALVAYLSLLAPPPGSLHEAVPANKIVFSGDSAGGNLCLVLLQNLLTLRRVSPTIRFHGQEIPIEIPAGLALSSPWCDITRSMPSVVHNAPYDFLAPPPQDHDVAYRPPPVPVDESWPVNPPRVDLFANANALIHPLVSPLAAHKELWRDAPPVFISVGEEGLTDEGLVVARRMHQVGVPVVVDQFEGMPHCFGMMMIETPAGRRFFDGMANFCTDVVAGSVKSTGNINYITYKLRSTQNLSLNDAVPLSDEEVDERLRKCSTWRVEGERLLMEEWSGEAKL